MLRIRWFTLAALAVGFLPGSNCMGQQGLSYEMVRAIRSNLPQTGIGSKSEGAPFVIDPRIVEQWEYEGPENPKVPGKLTREHHPPGLLGRLVRDGIVAGLGRPPEDLVERFPGREAEIPCSPMPDTMAIGLSRPRSLGPGQVEVTTYFSQTNPDRRGVGRNLVHIVLYTLERRGQDWVVVQVKSLITTD